MTAKFCIKHKVSTLLAVIMISIFGVVFTTRLQMALLPDMEAPMAMVMSYYNGATPSDVEEMLTRPLETAILSVSGVESVSSSSSNGVSQLQVTYVEGTDLDVAAMKLREQFDLITLPDGAMDPVIVNISLNDLMPTAMVALIGDDLSQLQYMAEETVGPALERIDGVAQVSISGGVSQQIAVEVDSARAGAYGLSKDYISQFLMAENLLYPGGEVQNGTKTLTVSTDAKFQSVDDVRNMLIATPTGGLLRLGEVAKVTMESVASDNTAKVDGTACVVLQVSKQSGANEVGTAEAVVKQLAKLQKDHPSLRYTTPYLASDYINIAVNSALQNIVLGVLLAAIVVFLFLRRWGATLTIAVSMPVCILTVFILMNVFDLTMNMMSLGGIAMGVGMIVDNSIVVLENIYRYASEGHDRMTACVEGTKEVTTSVVASTLTTVAVFLPLGLTGGMAGMLFDDFCLTISFLILGSMFIALTWVPVLCYMMLDPEKVRAQNLKRGEKKPGIFGRFFGKLNEIYLKLLNYFVHHLKTGIAVSVGVVAVFAMMCASSKMVLLPPMDMSIVSVNISTPIGSEVDETTAIADQVSEIIQKEIPEYHDLYYTAGAESASVSVNLVGRSERSRTANEVAADLRTRLRDIAGCELTVSSMDMGSMMGGSQIGVQITGSDYNTLEMIAEDLVKEISALPDAVEVTSSVERQVPEVKITMKREAAASYGLTAATVGAAVRSELTGATATTVMIDNKVIDVVVRGSGAASKSMDALKSMMISTPMGSSVPLSAVAEVQQVQTPKSISRVDQARRVTVSGSTLSGDTAAMTQAVQEILDRYPMPEGYEVVTAGAYEDMMESVEDLLLALAVALGLVYFVLAAQFESFLMPVIVMMIIPVAFSGALASLPLVGHDLSLLALVALIMLSGTVVNNSIILVEYIKIRRDRGEDRETAILNACPLRIRPVMMTTITTVLAMVPLAFGMGESNEMMSDMGIAMMGGMIISTLVTLVFTPVFYSVIDDIPKLFRRKKAIAE
ncbi:MAG: efflux RND transporter permease subunit [Oscillibacter sp.]|nr:efflux RND transporter permease subunit [Oscillibacter sp.]